jgi:hypothetical protein
MNCPETRNRLDDQLGELECNRRQMEDKGKSSDSATAEQLLPIPCKYVLIDMARKGEVISMATGENIRDVWALRLVGNL